MGALGMILGLALAVGGAGLALVSIARARELDADPRDYLLSLEGDIVVDEFQQRLTEPFIHRVLKPLGSGMLSRISSLAPSKHLERLHQQLLHAGLTSSVSAEEFVVAQVLATGLGLVAALAWSAFGDPPARLGVLGVLLLPTIGALTPHTWLTRRVRERKDSIRHDLPDVLDLLAISVEAGIGFEGALAVVCRHFQSPLADEFSRTLKEMELGLPRREALQNLKRRTEVPELSNFVLALMQADALGMPVGRVLKTQAAEMRTKRRQWAREKAGKLPVKILFPLVVFIFPAVLVVILGPAGASIATNL